MKLYKKVETDFSIILIARIYAWFFALKSSIYQQKKFYIKNRSKLIYLTSL